MKINTFQLRVLIDRWLKDKKRLVLQYSQPSSEVEGVSLEINMHPTATSLLPSRLDFLVNGGSISIDFSDLEYDWMEKRTFDDPQYPSLNLDLNYDNDKPSGYYLSLGNFKLLFYGERLNDYLTCLDAIEKDYIKSKKNQHISPIDSFDPDLPDEYYHNLANMFED